MKMVGQLFEDLATRRQLLKQRQRDQASAYKEKSSGTVTSAQSRDQKIRAGAAEKAQKNREQSQAAAQERESARQARLDAREKAEAEREKEQRLKDELRQELQSDKQERNVTVNKKRMSKERVQSERREKVQQVMKRS